MTNTITAQEIFDYSVRSMDLSTEESRKAGREEMIKFLTTHDAVDEKTQALKDAILNLYRQS